VDARSITTPLLDFFWAVEEVRVKQTTELAATAVLAADWFFLSQEHLRVADRFAQMVWLVLIHSHLVSMRVVEAGREALSLFIMRTRPSSRLRQMADGAATRISSQQTRPQALGAEGEVDLLLFEPAFR